MASRKLFLFVLIILLKILGLNSFKKFIDYLMTILGTNEIINLIPNLDFSVIYESSNYSYINIDSNNGFLKCIEQLLIELIGTTNLRFEDKNFEEENWLKVNNKFNTLVSLINLIETYIRVIKRYNFNITNIYNFYSGLQYIVIYYLTFSLLRTLLYTI
jgi:hypothetical protein